MNTAGDANMLYLVFGTAVGIVLGINIAFVQPFSGTRLKLIKLRLKSVSWKAPEAKDEYIAKGDKR